MTPSSPLLVSRQGGIVTLQFNRPEAMNALDVPTANALLAATKGIAADAKVRAVLLKGSGKAFVAGGDLATLQKDPVQGANDLLLPLNQVLTLLQGINAPVIAQVHGAAAGAGLSLMLMCDFVLAAEGTKFNLAYIKLGTSCDVGASWALPRIVGLRHALEIALLGDTYGTDDALRLGLVNRVVPAAELEAETMKVAGQLAMSAPLALRGTLDAVNVGGECGIEEGLQYETAQFGLMFSTEDMREGTTAFLERRKPEFQGR